MYKNCSTDSQTISCLFIQFLYQLMLQLLNSCNQYQQDKPFHMLKLLLMSKDFFSFAGTILL